MDLLYQSSWRGAFFDLLFWNRLFVMLSEGWSWQRSKEDSFWWHNFPRVAGRHAMGEMSQFCGVGLQATYSHRTENAPSIWLCGHWSPLRDMWGVDKLRPGSSPLAKRWREDYTQHNPGERKDVEGDVKGRRSSIPTLNPTLGVPICILHKLCIHQLLNPQPWDTNAITSLIASHM